MTPSQLPKICVDHSFARLELDGNQSLTTASFSSKLFPMKTQSRMTRRQFVQKTAIGAATLTSALSVGTNAGAADPYRGLKMGVASISFRNFTLDEGIVMVRELGVK